jgi:hypothetical protein
MPALVFLSVAGLILVALLFVADATLERNDSPVIVTSQRSGLPEPPRHSNGIRILTAAPAPEPDMTSRAVLDAQPKSEPEALAKIHPEARAARAEVPSENKRDYQKEHYQRNEVIDRFSIKGQ